jgi:serine/threonine protein kinase/tetratricopeptide (TPR) repeat protein
MTQPSSASTSLAKVKEIFLALVDLKGDIREAELLRHCGSDGELRAKVLRMLESHTLESGFLDSPAAVLLPEGRNDPSQGMPRRLGPYAVSRVLGEGGFGSVYLAKQEVPIRREVAIKVIRRGMDSRGVIARFEAERQTLALLSHPNIARVFDAGETEDGRPYFVMELLHGVPVTRHCDEARLGIEDRLRLFIDTCRAVEHAHQKGVIHRDIKPSNVMVQAVDGRVEVKVIDFGIAKAIDTSAGAADRLITSESQLLGTPDYMSPEQVDSRLGDIDTRVDIYALGALLYELLVGVTPLNISGRDSSSLSGTLQAIREEEPLRPSQRAAASTEAQRAATATRRLDPRRHRAALAGDLDWIVMKAIEKDRSRRYDSVGTLVTDIERYLAHQPVLAARPSPWYVTRKFVRRHRVGVTAAMVAVTSLAAGLIATSLSLSRAVGAEARANLARDELATVNDFLVEDILGMARPSEGGQKMSIVDAMANALKTVDQRFTGQPILAARVRLVVGSAYRSLGLFDEALAALEPSAALLKERLGPSDPLTLEAHMTLTGLLSELGRLDDALTLIQTTEGEARAALGIDHRLTLQVRAEMGEVLQKLGRTDEADAILIDTIDRLSRQLQNDDSIVLAPARSLVASLTRQRRYAEALPYSEMVMQRTKARYSKTHPTTLAAMNGHGAMLTNLGRLPEAEATYRALLAAVTEAMPEGHWQIAITRMSLGMAISRQGDRPKEATDLLRSAAFEVLAALGPDNPFTERAFNAWSDHLKSLGDPGIVEPLRHAVGLRLRVAAPEERDSVVRSVQAYVRASAANRTDHADGLALDELEADGEKIIAQGERQRGAQALANLGWASLACNDRIRAERLLLRSDAIGRAVAQPDERFLRETAHRLATLYDMAGRSEEASLWATRAGLGDEKTTEPAR